MNTFTQKSGSIASLCKQFITEHKPPEIADLFKKNGYKGDKANMISDINKCLGGKKQFSRRQIEILSLHYKDYPETVFYEISVRQEIKEMLLAFRLLANTDKIQLVDYKTLKYQDSTQRSIKDALKIYRLLQKDFVKYDKLL